MMVIKDAAAAVNLYSPKFFNRIAFDFEFSEEFDEYSDACEVLANHAARFFDETPVDPQWIMKVIPAQPKSVGHRAADEVYKAVGYSVPDSGSLKGSLADIAWSNYADEERFFLHVGDNRMNIDSMTRGQLRALAFAAGVLLAE